jgi:membrane-associated phospholipid phosphatase
MPGASEGYVPQVSTLVTQSAGALLRSPSHSRRAEARRRLARHSLWLATSLSALIVVLMFVFDTTEIGLMPTRGAPELWPVRLLTDFGKDTHVLLTLAILFIVIALGYPLARSGQRPRLASFANHIEYLFFAVAMSVLVAEGIKWIVGRGRPFVGGKADAFNFVPFTGTEAYFSFPSGHAVTAFALAFGIAAIWPRLWILASIYALLIAASRLVLLAHHPSDVVGGALIGIVGAMAVRYWFAARRVGFDIRDDGRIVSL